MTYVSHVCVYIYIYTYIHTHTLSLPTTSRGSQQMQDLLLGLGAQTRRFLAERRVVP